MAKTGPFIDQNTIEYNRKTLFRLRKAIVGMRDNIFLVNKLFFWLKHLKGEAKRHRLKPRGGWLLRLLASDREDVLIEEEMIAEAHRQLKILARILGDRYSTEAYRNRFAAYEALDKAISNGEVPEHLRDTMLAAIDKVHSLDTISSVLEAAVQSDLPQLEGFTGEDVHVSFHAHIKAHHEAAHKCHSENRWEDYLHTLAKMMAYHRYAQQFYSDNVSEADATHVLTHGLCLHDDVTRFADTVKNVFVSSLNKCQQAYKTPEEQIALLKDRGIFSSSNKQNSEHSVNNILNSRS